MDQLVALVVVVFLQAHFVWSRGAVPSRCEQGICPPVPSDSDADEENEGEEGARALGDESAEGGDEGADGISSY